MTVCYSAIAILLRLGILVLVRQSARNLTAQQPIFPTCAMDNHYLPPNTQETYLQRIQLFLYLVPVFGFFPAIWTLYRRQGSREQQRVSRLVITLTFAWLLAYGGLATASGFTSEVLTVRMLYANALLTSSYFLTCLGLMIRLWQQQSLRLPGVSRIAETTVRRYLSE